MAKKLSDSIGQFATVPNSFITTATVLSTEAKWLFVILRYHTNSKTGNAFPSYATIHELTGYHRNTISKCLKELEAAEWLTKQRRFGASTLYTLQIPNSTISETTDSHISETISSTDGVYANQTDLTRLRNTPLPPFQGEAFLHALGDYQLSRVEQKHKPLGRVGLTRLFTDLAAWGELVATDALRAAVRNGWQGVYPPKANGTVASYRRPEIVV